MNIEYLLFSGAMAGIFLTMILYLIFGQITVRKLRKNVKTKDNLGFEVISGWSILNVASALCTPKWLREKLNKSRLSYLSADYQVLYEHTTSFDRILARMFWAVYLTSGTTMIFLVIFNSIGLFDS